MRTDGLKKAKNPTAAKSPPTTPSTKAPASAEAEPPIKLGHLLILLVVGVGILVGISFALESHWQQKQPLFENTPKLIAALQAFSRDRFVHGMPLPPSVSLNDLVSGGYLSTNDVRAFQGIELTISTSAKGTNANEVLIHARLPDGSVVALLGDGSIQQIKK